ncbi:hypothetical protein ILUMI_13281 [Ignelater luminosus]|uniref:FLYWCH-type domain-containing protein n=1 Tax=Ignelater luminosus TaxID=2038154 RepID=A0A8K0CX12_IGNLU|nr:hypothetical protein ILUMI_13281 [Ignelater luminosus]
MASQIEIVTTIKGKQMLCLENYNFVFERAGLETDMWECRLRCDSKSRARIHTSQGKNNRRTLKSVGAHNYESNAVNKEKSKVLANIWGKAIDLHDAPAQIVARNLETTTTATKAFLPKIQSKTTQFHTEKRILTYLLLSNKMPEEIISYFLIQVRQLTE